MNELIIIKSIMKPRDYHNLRSLLKEEQGEKVAPYVFKALNTGKIREYLEHESINYEVYDERVEKEQKSRQEQFRQRLIADYQDAAKDQELNKELQA